ncbi:MAG: MOSC domain-containing protein [Rhizobiaceae bacterium]
MNLPFQSIDDESEIVPAKKLLATVTAVLKADGGTFETKQCERLEMTLEGIAGDFHAGFSRRSGGREPWYPRGTEMRNERQISIVATDEMAATAAGMGIQELRPEWIGANLVIDGVPRLSMLPPRTLLFFRGGVTLKVDGQNAPCSVAGASIAKHARMADELAGSRAFPRVAKRARGLVAWVEKAGVIEAGEEVSVRIPEQWIYRS